MEDRKFEEIIPICIEVHDLLEQLKSALTDKNQQNVIEYLLVPWVKNLQKDLKSGKKPVESLHAYFIEKDAMLSALANLPSKTK